MSLNNAPEPIAHFYDARVSLKPPGVPPSLSAPYEALYGEILKQFPGRSAQGLEIACGVGVHCLRLAELGYKMTGFDLSRESLQKAEQKKSALGLKNCTFHQGEAGQLLAVHPGPYDFILFVGSLYYFEWEEMLTKAQSYLKPNGRIFCIETNGSQPILNLYRRTVQLVRHRRDDRTLNHLLRLKDWNHLQQEFTADMKSFDFFTLIERVLERFGFKSRRLHRLCCWLDQKVLSRSWLRILAFKFFVIILPSRSGQGHAVKKEI